MVPEIGGDALESVFAAAVAAMIGCNCKNHLIMRTDRQHCSYPFDQGLPAGYEIQK